MKKLLALIVLLLGFTDTQAQNFMYRPLKEFHGDTIAFLKSNFYDQRSYFAGKKFGVLLELYMRDMPLKGCYAHGTSPFRDPDNESYICGAWLRPMENSLLPRDASGAIYAATFDIDFATPYISSYYAFGKSLPDKVTPYGIASLLKDFVIKDIRIDVYDRRRSH